MVVAIYHTCGASAEPWFNFKGFICMGCGKSKSFELAGKEIKAVQFPAELLNNPPRKKQ